ncbi:MAG: type 4a pilus biogenesis protein PilO [Nitrospinae bacterium]|nr:type 4a pilus biogenesis protein PilO [Nitrospinota bacterium]
MKLDTELDKLRESIDKAMKPLYDKLDEVPYDKLFNFPWFYRWGVFMGITIVICSLYYYFSLMPLQDEITALEKKSSDNKAQIIREMSRLKRLPTIENELALIREKLIYAQNEFPTEKEIPLILDKISKTAKKNGLVINTFRPSGEKVIDYYAEVSVEIKMVGDYHQIMHFINDTRRIPRLIKFDTIHLTSTSNNSTNPAINFSSRLVTYRYIKVAETKDTPKKK